MDVEDSISSEIRPGARSSNAARGPEVRGGRMNPKSIANPTVTRPMSSDSPPGKGSGTAQNSESVSVKFASQSAALRDPSYKKTNGPGGTCPTVGDLR